MQVLRILLKWIPVLSLVWACSESDNKETSPLPPPPSGSALGQPVKPVAFSEPASTAISVEKARQFADASAALALLAQQWSTRLEKASDVEKVQIGQSYTQAREQLICKLGLAGNAEFLWIQSKALADPSNRDIFAQAGVKVSQ